MAMNSIHPNPPAAPAPAAPSPASAVSPAAPAATPRPAPAAAPVPVAAPVLPPPVPASLAALGLPFQGVDHTARGVHAEAVILPDQVVAAGTVMDQAGYSLDTITGVDWLAQGQMEVVYDFFHPTSGLRVALRTRVPRDQAELPTLSGVFPGANWHERETHDFFGIRFTGHPDLTPFLLPEDATFHPLRKDYAP